MRERNDEEDRKMTYQCFLIKYAEIGLKGKNRHVFENILRDQVQYHLDKLGIHICCRLGNTATNAFDGVLKWNLYCCCGDAICIDAKLNDVGFTDIRHIHRIARKRNIYIASLP